MQTQKTLAQQFLTEAEQKTISALVQQMEQQTSGEIVPMVVSASHSYPTAIICGATALALPLSLLLMPVVSGLFWLGSQNVWIFIALFLTLYGIVLWTGAPIFLVKAFIPVQESGRVRGAGSGACQFFYRKALQDQGCKRHPHLYFRSRTQGLGTG